MEKPKILEKLKKQNKPVGKAEGKIQIVKISEKSINNYSDFHTEFLNKSLNYGRKISMNKIIYNSQENVKSIQENSSPINKFEKSLQLLQNK